MTDVYFPVLGMYTDARTPISVLDDFGDLIPVTVTNWNRIYDSHFASLGVVNFVYS